MFEGSYQYRNYTNGRNLRVQLPLSHVPTLQAFDLLSDQDARNIYDAQSGPPTGQADAADDATGDAAKERHEVASWPEIGILKVCVW